MFWVQPRSSYQLDGPGKPPKGGARNTSIGSFQCEEWTYFDLPPDVWIPYPIAKAWDKQQIKNKYENINQSDK